MIALSKMAIAIRNAASSGNGNVGSPGVTPLADDVFNAQVYLGDGSPHRNVKTNIQMGNRYVAFGALTANITSIQIAHPKLGHVGQMTIVLCGTSSSPGTYYSPDAKGGTQGSGQVVQWTYIALGDEVSFTFAQMNTAVLTVNGGANNGKTLCVGSGEQTPNGYGAANAANDQTASSTLTATKIFSGASRPYNSTITYSNNTSYPASAPASYGDTQTSLIITSDLTVTMYGATSPGGCAVNGYFYGRALAAVPETSPGESSYGFYLIYFDPTTSIFNSGGLAWFKNLSSTNDHVLISSARSAKSSFSSNNTATPTTTNHGLAYSADGMLINSDVTVNSLAVKYSCWMFRKAYKFFDVVPFIGDSNGVRAIAHALGIKPGMIIIKNITTAADPAVYHQSIGATKTLYLTLTNGSATASIWGNTEPDASNFYVDGINNTTGNLYEAYIFAHDTSTTGVIQCGQLTVNSTRNNIIDLGGEAQWIVTKKVSTADAWREYDYARDYAQMSQAALQLESSVSESSLTGWTSPEPNGFQLQNSGYAAADVVVWIAIKRSTVKPTNGRQVFNALTRFGTGSTLALTGVGFAPDLHIGENRSGGTGVSTAMFTDRVRGKNQYLNASTSGIEVAGTNTLTSFDQDGVTFGTQYYWNQGGISRIEWFLKRAAGVFDITTWVGNGATSRSVFHNLGVLPELIITKSRSGSSSDWKIYQSGYYTRLNSSAGNIGPIAGGTMGPNNSSFIDVLPYNTSDVSMVNNSGSYYVAYLFATLAGVSKVGTFTGNGTNKNINCGFTNGARFIIIKRLSATGNWFIFDTARGIITGNDRNLSWNITSAEVNSYNSIEPLAAGFTVVQNSGTNINVSGQEYQFLAIS